MQSFLIKVSHQRGLCTSLVVSRSPQHSPLTFPSSFSSKHPFPTIYLNFKLLKSFCKEVGQNSPSTVLHNVDTPGFTHFRVV